MTRLKIDLKCLTVLSSEDTGQISFGWSNQAE